MGRALGAVRVVHPVPSLVNAALVVALAIVAAAHAGGAPSSRVVAVAALGLGMLGLQFCIGATNDYVDAQSDARSKPSKPIPSGLISSGAVRMVALACGGEALVVAGMFGPLVLAMAAAMLAAGLTYDLWLKPTPLAWLCFSIAFPILPVYAWFGMTGQLPPNWGMLLPMAALAGPAIQLANGLVDLDADERAGLTTLAVRLGRRRVVALMSAILIVIHVLAWSTLAHSPSAVAVAAVASGSLLAITGVALSARVSAPWREAGWQAQCLGIAALATGWLLAAASA